MIDLEMIIGALRLLKQKIEEQPIEPLLGSTHRAAYLERQRRAEEVDGVALKVRGLIENLRRL